MQVGSKRRRTQRQIEEDKQEEVRKEAAAAGAVVELANLRSQIRALEQQVSNSKTAANLLSQMINAGHVQQDSETSVILQTQDGQQQRFGADPPPRD